MSRAITYTTHVVKYFRAKAFTTSSSGSTIYRLAAFLIQFMKHSYVLFKPRDSPNCTQVYPDHLIHSKLRLFLFCFFYHGATERQQSSCGLTMSSQGTISLQSRYMRVCLEHVAAHFSSCLDHDSIWQEVGKDFPLKGNPLDVSPQINASALRLAVP